MNGLVTNQGSTTQEVEENRIKLVVLVMKNKFLGNLTVRKTRSQKRNTYFKTITGDLMNENETTPWSGLTWYVMERSGVELPLYPALS